MMNDTNEDKERLISLAEASEIYGFSHVHLRQMAREGRMEAQKVGRYWVTTPANVEEYIASRKKTGRYREDIQVQD
jgi:hypothetical protein